MNAQGLVDALKAHAADAAVHDVLAQWTRPSGRSPGQDQLERADWYGSLTDQDRLMIHEIVRETAHTTLFGVLCILDGARKVEDSSDAHLELSRVKGGAIQLLASSDFAGAPLHELI